jgi:hypothetical protein
MRNAFAGLLALSVLAVSGCSMARSPIMGFIYQDVSDVLLINPADSHGGAMHLIPENPKVGTAKATSIVGVTLGDSSLDTARRNGGIRKVHYVDYHTWSVMSVYGWTETRVYGE